MPVGSMQDNHGKDVYEKGEETPAGDGTGITDDGVSTEPRRERRRQVAASQDLMSSMNFTRGVITYVPQLDLKRKRNEGKGIDIGPFPSGPSEA